MAGVNKTPGGLSVMSEIIAPEPTTTTTPPPEGDEPKTFDADYVAKLRAEAAKYRTEAKANADAAKRLAEIEEANKTESQKQADRVATLEREALAAKAEAARFRVAARFAISDEDADLFLTGTDEETLTKQATRLAERVATSKKQGNVVPKEGTTANPPGNDVREFARQLFSPTD